jgi:preprotein translocase subunit SecG
MITFLIILTLLACVFLVLVVMAQNPKGGGLSANLTGTSQIMGARRDADFVEKATWGAAITIIVLVMVTNFFMPSPGQAQQEQDSGGSRMEEQIRNLPSGVGRSMPGVGQGGGQQQQQTIGESPEEGGKAPASEGEKQQQAPQEERQEELPDLED